LTTAFLCIDLIEDAKHVVKAIDRKDVFGYIYLMGKTDNNQNMGSIIIRDIDEELRKRFRMLCLEKGISMNQFLKDLIKRIVDRGKLD